MMAAMRCAIVIDSNEFRVGLQPGACMPPACLLSRAEDIAGHRSNDAKRTILELKYLRH
jgi:hypothetical protein